MENYRVNWGQVIRWGGGILIGTFVLGWIIVVATAGMNYATAGLLGSVEAEVEIKSGDFRLQAYDQFFDLCEGVQVNEDVMDESWRQIQRLEVGSKAWQRKDEEFSAQYRARQEGIREYNADANRSWTVGQFRDENLAFKLDPEPYDPEERNKTVCLVN